jgi:nitrite reductase/ring-hydroxylating ferredoxin subunit
VKAVGFIAVGAVTDFPPGRGHIVRVARKPVALFNVDGRFFAVNNICPHLGGPIGAGPLEGAVVRCPYHGMAFDVTTGCSADAFGHDLDTYPVEIRNGQVHIGAWWDAPKNLPR